MNIVILTKLEIKNASNAAMIRILELAKAISFQSDNVVYITSLFYNNNTYDHSKIYSDFEIYNLGISSSINRNYFTKRYFSSSKKKKELSYICDRFLSEKNKTIFILYNHLDTFFDELYTIRYIKKSGFILLVEKNELSKGIALIASSPKGLRSIPYVFLKLFNVIIGVFTDELVKHYDGGFVISTYLKKFISKRTDAPFLKIPVLYHMLQLNDENVLKRINNENKTVLNLGYFGSISIRRDRVLDIMKAVLLFNNKYNNSELRLTISGTGSKKDIFTIKKFIKRWELQKSIKYIGFVDDSVLQSVQSNQDILIVLRNKSLQGRSSFATKLANYMHLGKIVVANNVSDNKNYIENGENGFLIENTEPETIAKLLIAICEISPDRRLQISKNALVTARQHFHYSAYSNTIQSFLKKRIEEKVFQ